MQWWVQDLQMGRGVRKPIIWQTFPEKCMKMKELNREGLRVPMASTVHVGFKSFAIFLYLWQKD